MIIDFHTHAFPDKLAPRALTELEKGGGLIKPCYDGTAAGLVKLLDTSGVDGCVALNIAVKPENQHAVNDFAISINGGFGGRVTAFGSVHPASPDALAELRRIKNAGIKGVKLHPDYQGFFVDDPALFPIYEAIGALGLITVFHAGIDIGLFEPVRCPPDKLAAVLPRFGGAPVVAAHFGGYMLWYDVERHLVGQNVYLDTGFCHGRIPFRQARRIVENHGAERVLFGSDAPWSDPAREALLIDSLELPQASRALIMGGNARRLLEI